MHRDMEQTGARFFHTDGRTDMKLIVAFRNFSNEPKIAPIRPRKHSEIRCNSCRIYMVVFIRNLTMLMHLTTTR